MISSKQLNTANYTQLFCTLINVNRHQYTAMINSDAMRNFMFKDFAEKKELFIQKKLNKKTYDLIDIDRDSLAKDSNRRVIEKIILLSVCIQCHHEELTFDIIEMISHNIVLKMS